MAIMNNKNSVSLDSIGEQSTTSTSVNPEDEFFKNESIEFVYKVLKETLTPSESEIVCRLFGMAGYPVTSLKKIAEIQKCPIDRVKKLRMSAFCKLKNSKLSEVCQFGFKNDIIELNDADSIPFFPVKQANDSAAGLENMEIDN